MGAAVLIPLIPSLIEGGFRLGDKALGNAGKNKQAAGILARVQQSDLKTIADSIDAMIQADQPVSKEVLAIYGQLIRRAADISDKVADALGVEDGK